MRHLLTIDDLTPTDINQIFCKTQDYLAQKLNKTLTNKIVMNVFLEHSTRTLTSFEIAAKKLGAHVINILAQSSSIKKGESIEDTFSTLKNINPDLIVIRAPNSGVPLMIAQNPDHSIIINAGDGTNEHPTQALIDAFTIKSLKGNISDLKIAICGDVLHSRVAHSNIKLLNILGAEVRVISPPNLSLMHLPPNIMRFNDLNQGLHEVDVIIVLRLQDERMNHQYVASKNEYFRIYGIDRKKATHAKADVIILHPGPINRGVEVSSEVADSNLSAILKQVQFSVPVRQAVFDFFASCP